MSESIITILGARDLKTKILKLVVIRALLCGFMAMVIGFVQVSKAETTLVRLTPEEYKRIIHHVFGSTIEVGDNMVQPGYRDENSGLLAVGERKLTITSRELEVYETLGQQISDQVVLPQRREILLQCQPKMEQKPDDKCASQFIARAGSILLRRPLTEDEIQGYVDTHHQAADDLNDFYAGLSIALTRILVDPEFLFRVERSEIDPANPDVLRLDSYSKASRLSFFLWDTAPDAELLNAAETEELHTQDGMARQVERMLQSPRMEDGVRAFFVDMLGFDKFATLDIDTTRYSKFTKGAESDAQEQTLRTIVDHLLNKDGDYRDLFTTRNTFLTPALAALYAVPLPRKQELGGAIPWVPYEYDEGAPYVGILGQVSFMSLHSHPARTSPTLRGKALRERLLCQKVPAPPGDVDFSLVQDTSNPKYKTVRQRLTVHSTDAICAGCHKITDRIGLSLEQFDTSGAFRTKENGAPIDASGDFGGAKFEGLKELSEILRDDPTVTACLIKRAYEYGASRGATPAERKWLVDVQSRLREEGVKWRSLMRTIATNPSFYTVIQADDSLTARTN